MDLERIKKIQLHLYKKVKYICEKHDIKYFAIGGTCIGAVRHSGFIPWDDDIDLVMPFDDYKRFIVVFNKEQMKGISLYRPSENAYCALEYIKVQDDTTTVVDASFGENMYLGVNIDIMPMFGMPSGFIKQKLVSFASEWLTYVNRRFRMPYDTQKRIIDRIIWKLLSHKRDKLNYNYFLEKKEQFLSQFHLECSDRVIFGWRFNKGILHPGYSYRNVFFTDDFMGALELPFEDTIMRVPRGFDRYLRMDFGDYMKLPPPEKQVSVHDKCSVFLDTPHGQFVSDQVNIIGG